MQRTAFAILGIALTAVGAWLSFVTGRMEYGPILFRSGLVLSALALALPQVKEFFAWFPPWLLACGALGLVLVIRWPKMAVVVVPVLVALWFLGPRKQKLPRRATAKPVARARR